MQIPIYQVDAFAEAVFSGNPAAVCPLEAWLPDAVMQAIAAENNLSETAFFVRQGDEFALRWFTPTIEVDLCGHATLASAFVIMEVLEPGRDAVRFSTSAAGELMVRRDGEQLVLDFPARLATPVEVPAGLEEALGRRPTAFVRASKNMAVFEDAAIVRDMRPDMRVIAALPGDGLIVTAPGGPDDDADFVSRYFAPHAGIDEDPVTGSAHCTLVPYWADRLNKTKLHARQVSRRGGELWCSLEGERVRIGGHAVLYLRGTIEVDATHGPRAS